MGSNGIKLCSVLQKHTYIIITMCDSELDGVVVDEANIVVLR